ncbi:MAG: hypothetical protein GX314_05195 [Clostridiaceae bacterium]|nr:hypothetical protein [Clostridiaceae bacterium]
MNSKKFAAAITELGDQYYEEASSYQAKSKKRQWVKGLALAACLCLVAAVAIIWNLAKAPDSNNPNEQDPNLALVATPAGTGEEPGYLSDAVGEEAEHVSDNTLGEADLVSDNTEAEPKVASDNTSEEAEIMSDETACMIAFFIYQGRQYEHYQWIEDTGDIVGTMLGTAVASIDESTERDIYDELEGSVGGDFYEVKGFDPEFMLAMKSKPGETPKPSLAIFICDDIDLKYPADLLEKHFRLSQNFVSAEYESGASWECGRDEVYPLSETGIRALNRFLCQLNRYELISAGEALINYGIDLNYVLNRPLAVLHLHMDNGLTATLLLNPYGYVSFGGVLDRYAQVPCTEVRTLLRQFTELDLPDRESAGIVWPPARFGRTRTLPLPVKNYDLQTAVAESDLVARVIVLNWLGEDNDNLTSFFEARVLETIKGKNLDRITLVQNGSSAGSDEALYTYGTELLVFLRQVNYPQYKNAYRSIGNRTTSVFIVKDNTGRAYTLDKYGNLTQGFEVESIMKWIRPGSEKYGELRQNWKEQDPYLFNEEFDDYYKYIYPYDTFVARVKKFVTKADPEATTAD